MLIEGMKDWVVPLVSITFLIDIHFNLEIPWVNGFWNWFFYGVLALVQILISIIIERRTPMTTGAICLFVLAWKIAIEITDAFFNEGASMLSFLVMLCILALQGLGI